MFYPIELGQLGKTDEASMRLRRKHPSALRASTSPIAVLYVAYDTASAPEIFNRAYEHSTGCSRWRKGAQPRIHQDLDVFYEEGVLPDYVEAQRLLHCEKLLSRRMQTLH